MQYAGLASPEILPDYHSNVFNYHLFTFLQQLSSFDIILQKKQC
jgi:hypothetical protein